MYISSKFIFRHQYLSIFIKKRCLPECCAPQDSPLRGFAWTASFGNLESTNFALTSNDSVIGRWEGSSCSRGIWSKLHKKILPRRCYPPTSRAIFSKASWKDGVTIKHFHRITTASGTGLHVEIINIEFNHIVLWDVNTPTVHGVVWVLARISWTSYGPTGISKSWKRLTAC